MYRVRIYNRLTHQWSGGFPVDTVKAARKAVSSYQLSGILATFGPDPERNPLYAPYTRTTVTPEV